MYPFRSACDVLAGGRGQLAPSAAGIVDGTIQF
jgi:hypothetical protein